MKKKSFLLVCSLFFLISFQSLSQIIQPTDTLGHHQATQDQYYDDSDLTLSQRVNNFFVPIVGAIGTVLFYDPFAALGIYDPVIYDELGQPILNEAGEPVEKPIALVVVWLVLGAVFFTVYLKFINIKGFIHSIAIVRGKYDNPNDAGEVSHFQALATALSATVGLGNIAGVAVAISLGGPGATVWMMMAGFLGMSLKFTECTLGVKYRKVGPDGKISGGPMYYLRRGFEMRGAKRFGTFLAALFAVLVIGASFGGGNMFQSNQAFSQFQYVFPQAEGYGALFGLCLALLVGLVVIGGIKGIARVTSKLVPFMALLYVGTALYIIGVHFSHLGEVIRLIFSSAFGLEAMGGGFFGALFVGFQRGAFSNEAGIGSSPIVHAAANTNEPVSEGMVALLEPFVDTVIVCTMTALVLICTGFHVNPDGYEGTQLTAAAFGSVLPWFPYILVVCIFLFAFSTMISWSYYGLKGFNYLFGNLFLKYFGKPRASDLTFYILFLACIVIGSSSSLSTVIDFSDMMILGMAFPNIIGLIVMSGEVVRDLKCYLKRFSNGEV